jgi:hypothetical protein
LADRAVARGKQTWAAPFFILGKGLADYRRGKFRAAIEGLEPLLRADGVGTEMTTEIHLLLAMARYQQGEEKAARGQLARAAKLLDQYLIDPGRSPLRKDSRYYYWHDWVLAWLLHREAQTLIEGAKDEFKK